MGFKEMSVPTQADAIGEINVRLRSRPLPEVVAAIDRYADLLPEVGKVRAKAAAGDRPGATMEWMVALHQLLHVAQLTSHDFLV